MVLSGAGQLNVATSAVVAADRWHHVLASLSGANLTLWVDGAQTNNTMVALETPLALDALRLGGAAAASAYQGALDEIWLALTPITTDDAVLARYCPAP